MAQLLHAETSSRGGFCRHKKVPDSEVLTKKAAEWDLMLRSLFLTLLIKAGPCSALTAPSGLWQCPL